MSASKQQGYALAAVLWLLAGLTIVVALVNESAVTAKERVAMLRDRISFMQASINARAQIQYRLSASMATPGGLNDGSTIIATDRTIYQIGANHWVTLQDSGGLLNLNNFDPELLSRHLQNCGVPQEQTPALLDALQDYTDSDNLSRINGAESDLYTWNKRPPPRNSPLLSSAEIWNIWGWSNFRTSIDKPNCFESFTTLGQSGFAGPRLNLATATPALLKASGLNDQIIQDIENARQNPDQLASRAAQNSNNGIFGGSIFSTKTLHIQHKHPSAPWTLSYILAIQSDNPDRPWTVTQLRFSSQAPQNPTGQSGPTSSLFSTPSQTQQPSTAPTALPWPQNTPAAPTQHVNPLSL